MYFFILLIIFGMKMDEMFQVIILVVKESLK